MNDESIRKYRKQINRNGWQVKLYKWTTGKEPSFIGYCPFFWATWTCVLLSPLTLIGKLLAFLGGLLVEFFTPDPETAEELAARQAAEPQFEWPSDWSIVRTYEAYRAQPEDSKHLEFCTDGLNTLKWIQATPNWETFYPAAKARMVAAQAKKDAAVARQKRLQAKRDTVVKYARYTVKPLLIGVSLTATYFLYKLSVFLISKITLQGLVNFGCALLIVLALMTACFGVAALFQYFSKRKRVVNHTIPEIEMPSKPSVLSKMFDGIATGVGFLVETVKMTYKKECPLIEWGEESKPIVKNVKATE